MTTRSSGRHRAPSPTSFAIGQSSGAGSAVAKTSAVIAVSSGLVAGMGMSAQAAPATVDTTANTAEAATSLQQAAGISAELVDGVAVAPSYGELNFTAKAAPKPVRKPAVTVRRATPAPRVDERVSRASARRELPKTEKSSTSTSSTSTSSTSTSSASKSSTSKSSTSKSSTSKATPAKVSVNAGDPGSAEFGATVLSIAARYEGIAYRYGGTTPSGFDCSGYTQYVFAQVGISLPRTSAAQRAAATRISRSEAMPGDLVFMPGHIGIYAGNGMMWDSPRTGESIHKRAVYSSSATYGRVN